MREVVPHVKVCAESDVLTKPIHYVLLYYKPVMTVMTPFSVRGGQQKGSGDPEDQIFALPHGELDPLARKTLFQIVEARELIRAIDRVNFQLLDVNRRLALARNVMNPTCLKSEQR